MFLLSAVWSLCVFTGGFTFLADGGQDLHAKFWASSSKIERVMLNFVFFTFLLFWLWADKNYLLAKFWASSSKIGQVMFNFIFCPSNTRAQEML